eukprot:6174869-Pleurochrysis_carterae.AAC.5
MPARAPKYCDLQFLRPPSAARRGSDSSSAGGQRSVRQKRRMQPLGCKSAVPTTPAGVRNAC